MTKPDREQADSFVLMQRDFTPKFRRIGFFVGVTVLQLFASIGLWTLRDDPLSIPTLPLSALWLFLLYCQFRILFQKRVMLPVDQYPVGLSRNLYTTTRVRPFGVVESIILDFDHERIHFQSCFTQKSFLARPAAWFSCDFSELTEVFVANITTLVVCTAGGQAYFRPEPGDSSELQMHLRRIVPEGHGERREFNRTGFLWVLGAIGGIMLGWLLTPAAAPDWWLWITMPAGAVMLIVLLRKLIPSVSSGSE